MREAPTRVLLEALWAAGASVRAYDPVAMDEAGRIYGERGDLVLAKMPSRRSMAPTRWRSSPSGRNSAALISI